ncbi:MAG: carboxymuconolactone decarboxylase family protein [Bacilli bacterium]
MTYEDYRSNLDGTGMDAQRRQSTLSPAAVTGRAAMEAAAPGMPDRLEAMMGTISPNMVRRIYEHIWGDVHQDATLGLRDRTVSAIAALTAVGDVETNLQLQIYIGLNLGLSPQEIVAVIEQTAIVAGFPRAQAALQVAREVFDAASVASR